LVVGKQILSILLRVPFLVSLLRHRFGNAQHRARYRVNEAPHSGLSRGGYLETWNGSHKLVNIYCYSGNIYWRHVWHILSALFELLNSHPQKAAFTTAC
jgi:hypothetical protein